MNKPNPNTYVAIMAGGIGSRFWPYSRVEKPKQFLDVLNTGKTLIQMTYERFLHICPAENIYVVTNEMYAHLVKEQIPSISDDQIIKEPVRRNTAPCIAYACQKIYAKDKSATIVVSPSDHLVLKEVDFVKTIQKGVEFSSNRDVLLTMGIKPSRPDTGYGYIQYTDSNIAKGIHKVKAFTEKPNLELAQTFIKSGDFLWNSGMFIWSALSIMNAMEKHLPDIFNEISSCQKDFFTDKEEKSVSKAYAKCTSISIDYGVMEKAENVFVLPADFGWSDIGTWASLYEIYEKDYLGNAVNGPMTKIYDGSDNMVMVPKEKLVVLNGIKNCCIIDTDDVLLIMDKSKEQEVKKITTDLKSKKLDKYL
ncbi:MAG: mannose-1-phosphate guanylyltransferase [Chitinophagales bacterium]